MASSQFKKLFEPGKIGPIQTRNRIVMSGMLTYLGGDDGAVNQRQIDYYETRARGGVGLVIVEALTRLNPMGGPPLNAGPALPGMTQIAEAVHKNGAKVATQLNMAVFMLGPGKGPPAAASPVQGMSDFYLPAMPPPREITKAEIASAVAGFAQGAVFAKQAGFDGVEIHAAHTFLINSFISPRFNKRTDEYGGSLDNRARFLVEIIRAIRAATGDQFAVWCKINGKEYTDLEGCITPELSAALGPILQQAGADAIDVSMSPPSLVDTEPGFNLDSATAIHAKVGIPVIALGRMTPELGEATLRAGKIDFVGMARQLVADPELPHKLEQGRPDDIVPCQYCNTCLHFDYGCAVNAARRNEREYEIKPAEVAKKVVVVGGGPAGMEAARVAALRGHKVTLFEQEDALGGLLILGSVLRKEPEALNRYLSTQIKKLGVKVEMGRKADKDAIAAEQPDAVVVAAGAATAPLPKIRGIDRPNVFSATQVKDMLGGKGEKKSLVWSVGGEMIKGRAGLALVRNAMKYWMPLGKRLVVVGRGLPGFELADFMQEHGKRVSLVVIGDAEPVIADEVKKPPAPRMRLYYENHFAERGGATFLAQRAEEVVDRGLVIINRRGVRQTIEGDTIIFAADYVPQAQLATELEGGRYQVFIAGDSSEPCGIREAITGGFKAARQI